jgi:hypothetical protein
MADEKKANKKKGRIKAGEPVKHGDGWRIRSTDESGKRQSEVHANPKDAKLARNRHVVEVEERKRGLRQLRPQDVTFKAVSEAWREVYGSRTEVLLLKTSLAARTGERLDRMARSARRPASSRFSRSALSLRKRLRRGDWVECSSSPGGLARSMRSIEARR